MNKSEGRSKLGGLQFEAVAWIDAASDVLRSSSWAKALRIGEVDVLDAIRTPLLYSVLKLARNGTIGPHDVSSTARAWQAVRKIAYRTKLSWNDHKARRNSPLPQPASVLFWPQLVTHFVHHLPVAASLRSLGFSTGFLLNRPQEFETVRRTEPNTAFAAWAWPEQIATAKHNARLSVTDLRQHPKVELPRFLIDVSQDHLLAELRTTLAAALPVVHEMAAITHAALRQLCPEVLVVGNDITLEGRTQCIVAALHGVPTVCPMHGIVSGEPLQGSHVADAVLVYGEWSRRDLISLGEDPERIHVCGAAHSVDRKRQTGKVYPQIKRLLGLAEGQPWVLLATSGPGHSVSVAHHVQVIEAVMRLSAAMPEVRFVAKLHPKDRRKYYDDAQRRVPQSKLVVFTNKSTRAPREFDEWLQGCNAIITGGSAAGLDALLVDVPVLSIDLAGELNAIDFINAGASLHARSESELRVAIERVLQGPSAIADVRMRAEAFLKEAFHELNGNPARLAAQTILSLRRPRLHSTSLAAGEPLPKA
jgi:hypothetical protein